MENKKFSWEFFFHLLYLHGGQPLSVGIFCAFRHNIKVFGVVIDGTFFGAAGCYPPHNFRAKALLSGAHFRGFSLLSAAQFSTVCIVIDDTVPRRFPNNCPVCGCYPPHISPHNGVAQALLSTAQFPVLQGFFRIFSKVIGLLSAAQFAVALAARPVLLSSALFAAWVVIRGTFSIL